MRTQKRKYEQVLQLVEKRTIITWGTCQEKLPKISATTFHNVMNKLSKCNMVKKIGCGRTRGRIVYRKTNEYTVKKAKDCLRKKNGPVDVWETVFAKAGGVGSVLDRVRAIWNVSIPADDLREHGQRSSWSGRIVLSNEGILDSSGRIGAYLRNLENVLPKYLSPNEMIECAMSDMEEQLTLRIKRVERTLSPEDLGNFYLLISSFERKLRNFIKNMVGKGLIKRLDHELPVIVNKWRERENADIKWGIKSEKELVNYADTADYMEIIRRYRRIFVESDEELMYVITNLTILAINGRNPLMHCRTLNQQKYYTTKSAIGFLSEWIKRRRHSLAS